ncbi:MAG TPA: class I SAM-dependent methyltransferase [Desulfobacteria bacterium]|nr:class I SAM-dependent methyltransferase [Desulfobacteria bacterium]
MAWVCPWWFASVLDNRVRKLLHDPKKVLGPYIQNGQTVVDIGCGPGMFSIAMTQLVGEQGRVIAADIQEKMLERLKQKSARAGVTNITIHKAEPDRIGISENVDFALAFYMVHEVPDKANLFREVVSILKPKSRFLVVEPKLHVSASSFDNTIKIARACGLVPVSEPKVRLSRAVLFTVA